ncbi:MAG: phosphate/phosphite/phosphonate ABC transporter substrate-binding protein, partial [Acidobacteriota bacterium]
DRLIRVSGSDDVYPLVEALARQFELSHQDFRIAFAPPTHTRGGAAGISLGETDIGLLSRPLSTEEKLDAGTYLHLAQDYLVFAAHRDVSVRGLSRQQLLDIYSGKITNWQQVGGRDAPITVLDRAEHTSLKIILRQQLLGSSFTVTPRALVLERPDDMISSLDTIENSVGYVSFGNAMLAGSDVKYMTIDGFGPSLDNFRTRRYPFSRPFGFLVGPEPSRDTMRFVQFMYGPEGQRLIENGGFAPVTMDLIIAVLPEQDLLAQEQRYAPLVDYLSQHLGLPTTVTLELLPNYGEVIKAFQEGRVNGAFLGSLAFALACAQAGVDPIARPEKDGISQYRGLIVTRKDSGIRNWTDLKGRSFGFVDKATTAGYLYPLIFLREKGVNKPEEFFGPIAYTGSHDLLFIKVFEGELDAGAAKDLMLEEVAKTRPEVKEALRVLAVSPPVPNNAFVLRRELDFPCFRCHEMIPDVPTEGFGTLPRQPEELNSMIGELLLNLHESPEGRAVLDALGADRFVRTTVDDVREVNRLIEEGGFDPADYRP